MAELVPDPQVFETQQQALDYLKTTGEHGFSADSVTPEMMDKANELVGTPIPTAFPPEEEQSS